MKKSVANIYLFTIALLLTMGVFAIQAEAQDCWQIYNDKDPITNHLNRAICEIGRKNLDGAQQEYEFIIRNDDTGQKHLAYLNLGVLYMLQNKVDLAVQNYLSAIQLKPDYAEAYFNLGAAYYKQRLLEKAEQALSKAIEVQPDYGRAHYSLGFVYLDQKKYDLALKEANKAKQFGVPYTSLQDKLQKVAH